MSEQPERPVETVQEWLRYAIVSGRYPGDLTSEGIGQPEAEEALQAVRRIHARVTKLLQGSQ
jgi:hypothetical protein